MKLDRDKLGAVRSVPSLAAREQARQQEIAQLEALIGECKEHLSLTSSELWQKVVAYIEKRESATLSELARQDNERELFRLQGEVRLCRRLTRQDSDTRNAMTAYEARVGALKRQTA